MKTQGKIWVIYNSEKKQQTKPMSIVQAQLVLLSMTKLERSVHLIWTPGWDTWVNLAEFLKSDQTYFSLKQPPKSEDSVSLSDFTKTRVLTTSDYSIDHDLPYTIVDLQEEPEKKLEFGYYDRDFHGEDLEFTNIRKIKAPDEKALKTKSKKSDAAACCFKIELVLKRKTTSFRTFSKKISLKGAYLHDEIPKEFMIDAFDLLIVNPFEKDPVKAKMLFRAKVVGVVKSSYRLVFIEQDQKMTEKLRSFLQEYVRLQIQAEEAG